MLFVFPTACDQPKVHMMQIRRRKQAAIGIRNLGSKARSTEPPIAACPVGIKHLLVGATGESKVFGVEAVEQKVCRH